MERKPALNEGFNFVLAKPEEGEEKEEKVRSAIQKKKYEVRKKDYVNSNRT